MQDLKNKIKLSNLFETGAGSQRKNLRKSIKITSNAVKNKMKTSDTICNIPSTKLSKSEILLLNNRLNKFRSPNERT